MSTHPSEVPQSLPERPNLRHLKDQAKDLLAAGGAATLAEAQFKIARSYGFASWPKLKAHVDSLAEFGQLKAALDAEDYPRAKALLVGNHELHRAPLGYAKNGPLTWVAECRVPWGPPTPERLAMVEWMLANGSDIHQGGDGPLMRAALNEVRLPMMELLVAQGADVNAEWNGDFPIIFAPCETLNLAGLAWLLEHGANPNCSRPGRRDTALDYLIGTYPRSGELAGCIDVLIAHGATTRYDLPGVLDILTGRLDRLADRRDQDPALVHRQWPELDCGSTGARRLLLQGATLLHVAAEFGRVDAARLLLERGADVNARAALDDSGVGGQTPIFHAASQFDDYGLEVAQLLCDRGADLSIRVRLPGHYERPGEIVECTPLEYALLFPGDEGETVELLRARASSSGIRGQP